ncbi:DHH family phosphoesterase [Ruminococcus difficilis]|uniref:Cyclic-di-AMP phosphodiesterase n=2 Tax=Ruminococcus TaxID=1263 RepID=A0A934WRZ7_9FIRM|nr:DHH family phosphoesterase [Ruminococcus difficilis]MBQ1354190.1 DHH family phosphoesterase [Ruminococcus sp.]MBK6088851.1 DHH family phosphoesterase [Ruminococcus difficilis]MBQ1586158.1 DHH family phosphoesterase [Ruminococcus sp.]MBQ1830274.1 DHH family phosphoesterase [Ruminococcus sp.]MBQ2427502.1 DHH family phosphoesterase [Ruminococcus sp.]
MRKKHWMLSPWFIIFTIVMLLMTTISANYNIIVFYVELGITVLSIAAVIALSLRFSAYIRGIVRSTADRINGIDRDYLERYKYPVAVVGMEGDIVWCNARFRKAIGGRSPEGDHINNYISGYDIVDIIDSDGVDVAVDGREFTVYCLNADGSTVCHFIENTYYKSTVREYHASIPCVALITFDNAEDFVSSSEEYYSTVAISVEANLQRWANEYKAMYKKITNNRYMIIFRDADIDHMVNQRFPILRDIRSIGTARHIATISVGLCRGSKTVRESELNARKALEMALGRGGDQVAIIRDNTYEFFGGTAAAAEKVSKVRMRVIANAISRAVADADKVYVMGHRFSDLDCVGAAIGMQCIMDKTFKKYSKVVINRETSMAQQLIEYTDERLESDIYTTPEEALRGITPKSLLIIVDTHLATSLESRELYERAKKIVVIDHHRKAVNYINNALVFCHEPSASSACEMCCEIISYLDDKPLGYIQADALLSGIMLDTKNFVLKTGVRTFEAAAYLRRKGANTLTVKELFSGSIDTYREKVDIVVRSEVHRGCAISTSDKLTDDIRLASAQAADEMLTLKGIVASFVIFGDHKKINISARSYGRINVQLIMEKMGGGGHQTMAATQLYNSSIEEARKQLTEAIDNVLDEAEEDNSDKQNKPKKD